MNLGWTALVRLRKMTVMVEKWFACML